jgi:hypothetical protein
MIRHSFAQRADAPINIVILIWSVVMAVLMNRMLGYGGKAALARGYQAFEDSPRLVLE